MTNIKMMLITKMDKKIYNQEYNKSEKGIEKRKKYHSNWYNKHKDESSLRCKKYRVARAEDLKEYNKQWRLDNIQEESLKDSEYAKKHPDKIREKSRRRRAKKLEVNEIFTSQDERFVYNLFNNECFNCKNKDNLCIDHVRPLSKGNALTVKNACVLCVSCNSSKGDKCPEEFYTESRFIELMNVLDTTIKEKIKENI